jgi:adenylosuccinate synthase
MGIKKSSLQITVHVNSVGEERTTFKIDFAVCQEGHEFGVTTGRPRRCGWLDIPLLR